MRLPPDLMFSFRSKNAFRGRFDVVFSRTTNGGSAKLPYYRAQLQAALSVWAHAWLSVNEQEQRHQKLMSPSVAQACGDPVDGKLNAFSHTLIRVAAPVTAQQLNLQLIQGFDVGQS
jgi:hypothetical protein